LDFVQSGARLIVLPVSDPASIPSLLPRLEKSPGQIVLPVSGALEDDCGTNRHDPFFVALTDQRLMLNGCSPEEDGKISKAFAVPVRDGATITQMVDGVERSLVRGVTAVRRTLLIDTNGRTVHMNTSVDALQDSRNILQTVRRWTAQTE